MKFLYDPLKKAERERRWRAEAGVARIRPGPAGFAASVADGTAEPLPESEPQMTSGGASRNAVSDPADALGEATMPRDMRDARFKMKSPLQPGTTIHLTELRETDRKRADAEELPLREGGTSNQRSNDARRHTPNESAHEEKEKASGKRSARSAGLLSRLIGPPVSNEDGPPLIINKVKFIGANERIQVLQTRIEKWRAESGKRTLLVTSAVQNEGKSFVALNLAAACASPRTPVLLIDANLRAPSLHRILKVRSSNCLNAYLSAVSGFASCIHRTDFPGLTFIPAGNFDGSTVRVFADPRMADFVDAARAVQPSQLIVIDSSAALAAPEVQMLAGLVDAVLLVIAANRTPRDAVLEAVDLLKEAPLFGVVLNRFEAPFSALRTIRRATS
ncbi:MAG: CpsD/CapB family tyrosine-protein kinase [Candidatus Binataceae bacterium]|jgi:Mrp family chromosome partitioning ATPase